MIGERQWWCWEGEGEERSGMNKSSGRRIRSGEKTRNAVERIVNV